MFSVSFGVCELYFLESIGYDIFGHRADATGFVREWYTLIVATIAITMLLVTMGFGVAAVWVSDLLGKRWNERRPVIRVKLAANFSSVVMIV